MKVLRTLIPVVLLLVSVAAAGAADATVRTIPLGPERSALTLVEQREDGLVYEVEVGNVEAVEVATRAGTFTRLLLPGFHRTVAEGSPELPMLNRLFEIPYGASVRVEVEAHGTRELRLSDYGITHPVFPAQPPVSKSADPASLPFVYDRSAYGHPSSRALAEVVELGTLRAVTLGRLEVSPFAYDPVAGTLRVHDRLTVRLHFAGSDPQAEAVRKAAAHSPFFTGLYERIDGYRGQHDLHPDQVRDVVTMAIVTPPAYEAQLADFVAWKRTRGFRVVVGVLGTPEVGTSTTSIKAWLVNLYNNGTEQAPAPSFVLFVGDTGEMPTWIQSGDCTDRPYCAIDGDLMPEMYYGRFSCSNPSNLQAMIDKTMMYDQFTMPDPSYLEKVVMIAGVDATWSPTHANGQINYGTTQYFNLAHGISSFTHLYPQSGSQDAQIVQEVSDGVGYVNYTAHGSQTSWADPTFTQANVNGLQNAGKYCLAVGNCCQTSDYDYSSECFAETWLRVANKGAIGYIGGSNSTYWDEDYYWGVGYRTSIGPNPTYDPAHMGAYDGVFHDHGEAMSKWYVTNDALIFCGNLAVTESGSSLTTYYWNIYNLMGDPSLSAYLGVPAVNNVTHPASIMVGWSSINVTAAPNSYVGLTRNGELLGAGTTDADGNLTLPLWGQLVPGTAHLCVTAQNRRPYRADVPIIAPSGPYLIVEAVIVNDVPSGDGDLTCDAGETVNLALTLRNVGVEAASGISAHLSTTDPFVDVSVATVSFPDIPAGGAATSGDFVVSFLESTPDGHDAPFDLHITGGGGPYDAVFHLTACAPILAYASATVDDAAPGGNGSGWIVPGETAQVALTLGNSGHGGANDAVLTVTDAGPYVEVLQGTVTCPLVPGQGQGTFTPLQLRVLPDCPVPAVLSIAATVDAGFGYQEELLFPLSVGGWGDDVEADRGWTLGVAGDNATSGLWTRADPNGTTYGGNTVQPEDDHTPAPGVACFVTGNTGPGGAPGEQDVDGGTTTLLSPAFNLANVDGATIHYWFWYTNNLGNNPGADYWDVQVSNNGTTWVDLEHTLASTNAWAERTFDLADYVTLTDQVRIRFRANDVAPNSLVEALVDDFVLTIEETLDPTDVAEPALPTAWRLGRIAPNPAAHSPMIRLEAPASGPATVRIYDVSGALVRTLHDGPVAAGTLQLTWDRRNQSGNPVGAGVYFVRLEAPGSGQSRQLVVIR